MNQYFKYLAYFFVALSIYGCETSQNLKRIESNDLPELVNILPKSIGNFEYESFHNYREPELGYSVRYRVKNLGYADIYIYPVPDDIKKYSHKEIVIGMTQSSVQDIHYYVKSGVYENFKIISSKAFGTDSETLSKVEALLMKNNLESYTLLYLTESAGNLIKARITVNDNEYNRSSKEWDRFIGSLVGFIKEHIEKA